MEDLRNVRRVWLIGLIGLRQYDVEIVDRFAGLHVHRIFQPVPFVGRDGASSSRRSASLGGESSTSSRGGASGAGTSFGASLALLDDGSLADDASRDEGDSFGGQRFPFGPTGRARRWRRPAMTVGLSFVGLELVLYEADFLSEGVHGRKKNGIGSLGDQGGPAERIQQPPRRAVARFVDLFRSSRRARSCSSPRRARPCRAACPRRSRGCRETTEHRAARGRRPSRERVESSIWRVFHRARTATNRRSSTQPMMSSGARPSSNVWLSMSPATNASWTTARTLGSSSRIAALRPRMPQEAMMGPRTSCGRNLRMRSRAIPSS